MRISPERYGRLGPAVTAVRAALYDLKARTGRVRRGFLLQRDAAHQMGRILGAKAVHLIRYVGDIAQVDQPSPVERGDDRKAKVVGFHAPFMARSGENAKAKIDDRMEGIGIGAVL